MREKPAHILLVTPLGEGGKGGIDRMTDAVRPLLAARRDVRVTYAVSRGQGHIALSACRTLSISLKLLTNAITRDIDLVHINLSVKGSTWRKIVMAAAARAGSVPYVLHLHGSAYDQFWEGCSKPLSRAITSLFEKAAGIIVLGSFWQTYITGKVPQVAPRITLLANATKVLNVQPAQPGGTEIKILFLGQLGPRKGIPDLLQALAQLKTKKNWSAHLAGDGDVEAYKQQASSLSIANRISFPGWVGPQQVEALLQQADILVLPSHEENLPMSVIEAMAQGLAVIATPVGAVGDIVRHGDTGLLVAPGDVAGLAQALQSLIGDAPLRQKLGRNAHGFALQNLNLETYANRLVAIWKAAIAAAPAHRLKTITE